MASIIIALSTYGSQRIKHPHTKQTISAYKMGVRRVKLSA